MTLLKIACVALGVVSLTAGAASAQMQQPSDPAAQSSMSSQSGAMNSGSMPAMSASDMKTMKGCQAMSHDAMMANGKCKAFMAAHPDMFNSDGTMKSDAMTPH